MKPADLAAAPRVSEYPTVALCLLLSAGCLFLLNCQAGPYLPGFATLSALLLHLAAPFFFVAAGFFWGEGLYAEPDDTRRRALTRRSCLHLAKKLLLFEPIVIAMRCCTALLDGWDRAAFAKRTVLELLFYPRGEYWIMQALLVDFLLLLPLVRRGKEERALFPALLLYALAALKLRFAAVLESGVLGPALRAYHTVFLSLHNALFFGLWFVLAGLLIAKHRARLARWRRIWPALLAVAWALQLFEALSPKPAAAMDWASMQLMFSLLAPLLFLGAAFFVRVPLRRPALLCRLAASLYLLHVPLVWGWTGVLRRLHILAEPRPNALVGAALSLASFALGVALIYRRKWQPVYGWIT